MLRDPRPRAPSRDRVSIAVGVVFLALAGWVLSFTVPRLIWFPLHPMACDEAGDYAPVTPAQYVFLIVLFISIAVGFAVAGAYLLRAGLRPPSPNSQEASLSR